MSSEQMDLFDWKPHRRPAEIIPFPYHRSPGATASFARKIVDIKRPKRTGILNRLRNRTLKELQPVVGTERAEFAVEAYISAIRRQFFYLDPSYGDFGSGSDDGPSAA